MMLYSSVCTLMNKERPDSMRFSILAWSLENDLVINRKKTKVMKFRKGGTLANTDVVTCGKQTLEIVKSYKYLGVTLQVSGHSFTKHIEERAVRAIKATFEIKKLSLLSVRTGLKLFNIKIAAIASYGLQLI